MNKKTGKEKILFLFFVLALLAGCGRKEEIAEESSEEVYIAEYQIFQMGENSPYLSVFDENGGIFFAGCGKDRNGQLYFLEAGQREPEEIETGISAQTWITGMNLDRSGNLILACSQYEENLKLFELKKVSADGSVIQSLDLTEIFRNIPGFEAGWLAGDGQGNYYIGDKKKLYLISPEGKLVNTLEMEVSIEDLFWTKEDNLLFARLSNGTIAEVREDKFAVKNLDSHMKFGQGIYTGGKETELLYSQGDALYACNVKDEEPNKVLNWTDCNINSACLQSFVMLEDGRIAAFSVQNEGQGECEVALLTKTPKENVPEKTVITYGCVYPSSLLCAQVVRFNKLNTQYHVELKQYTEGSMDINEAKDILRMDILSGNAPDLLDIGVGFSEEDHFALIEAGALEDLTPYFEKETRIHREDYLEQVLEVYQREQALYAIMPTFGLYGLVGKEEVIGERNILSLEDLTSLYREYYGDKKLVQGFGRRKMLEVLCQLNMDRFVDGQTGECHFEEESFIQILELAGRFGREDKQAGLEQVRNGEVLFMEASLLSVSDFQYYEYLFGEQVRIIGYPADGENGLMALPCVSVLSMNKQSQNKEGVWEFICFLLEEDQQAELGRSGAQGIPVKRSVIEELCEEQMEIEYEEDEEGNLQERSKTSWKIDDMVIKYYAVTRQEADYFKELLEQIGNSCNTGMRQGLLTIIQEEAEAYFEGVKPAWEAARVIQNRAQNYINETASHTG